MKLREYFVQFIPEADAQLEIINGDEVDALGLGSKLGGDPDWVQEDEVPDCPSCGEKMTFVAQLDSIEHDSPFNPHRIDCLSDQQHFMFGDVGMIYVFFCFDCCETKSVFQSH